MLPYPQETAADSLYLCDESGIKIPVSDYDDAAKAASFPIDHTGTYTMAATKDPDSPAQTAEKNPASPARTAAKDSESSAPAGEKDPDSPTQTATKDFASSAMADGKDPASPTLTADAERGRSPLLFLLPASLLLLSAGVLFLRRRWK